MILLMVMVNTDARNMTPSVDRDLNKTWLVSNTPQIANMEIVVPATMQMRHMTKQIRFIKVNILDPYC